jgi:hypothetical protein
MRISKNLFSVLCSIWLCAASALSAQTTAPAASAPAKAASDSGYPEQAYLSPSRYTNQYFDFSFDLPPDVHLEAVPQPVARDGTIQLLELGGPAPTDAEISISAVPTAAGTKQDAKALLRFALDQELYRGVEELRGLSKANIGGHQFYLFETRRGIEQHVVLATTLGDYILRAVLAAHDEKTVHRMEAAFDHFVFFSPPELKQFVAADAHAYDGPSISSHRLEALEADPPANHIDAGKIQGDFYENPTIGFSYRIPQGWALEANGAVEPAIERYRAKEDFGRPRVGRTEHQLMDACSRTLFSVWAKRPSDDGQISYDDFGEVTVSAISLACFPRMKFPTDSTDQKAAKEFLLQFGLTKPIVDDMRDGKEFTAGGNVFLFLHGAVGFQVPDDPLSRRLSIGMAITQRRGYLLTWFFAAPHDEELKALSDERVVFDNAQPVQVVNATKPGDGVPAGNSPSNSTAAPTASSSLGSDTAAGGTSAASPNAPGNSPASTTNTASSDSPTDAPATPPAANSSASGSDQSGSTSSAQNADHPSLLRPGETMQGQQGKGAAIPSKNQSH